MGDQIRQKLRQARDAFRPGDQSKNRALSTPNSVNSTFYEMVDDESDENALRVDRTSGQRSVGSNIEPLNALLLRHRQLAQALLSVEGIDDDETGSISSRSSHGEIALLHHDDGAMFVRPNAASSPQKTPVNVSDGMANSDDNNSSSIGADFVDLGPEMSSVVDLEEYCCDAIQDEASPWYQRLVVIMMAWFVDLIDAFSETNDDVAIRDEPKTRLNVKELRQNIRRCRGQARPYLETLAGLWDLVTWRSPLFTLLLFWVYMYCVWKGCVISIFLFLVLLQLAINYLSYCRKVKLGLTLLPRKEIEQEMIESPGAQLVLEVALHVQVMLDYVADVLEKIKNLLKWKRPRTTAMFGLLVLFWFTVSLITTTSVFLTIFGFGVGLKLFVTTYLYYRFPRLRHRMDVFTWFLDRTPADHSSPKNSPGQYSQCSPQEEHPSFRTTLSASEVGSPKLTRTCALIDKEKSFPFNIGSGKLYLTSNHILFKYSRWASGERHVIKIHFDDILAIKKTRAFKIAQFGDGTALEIYVSGRDKPYLFAGIVGRDECYETLLTLGRTAGVTWVR